MNLNHIFFKNVKNSFFLFIKNWRTPEGKILKPIGITAPLPSYFKKKSEELFGIDAESDLMN